MERNRGLQKLADEKGVQLSELKAENGVLRERARQSELRSETAENQAKESAKSVEKYKDLYRRAFNSVERHKENER